MLYLTAPTASSYGVFAAGSGAIPGSGWASFSGAIRARFWVLRFRRFLRNAAAKRACFSAEADRDGLGDESADTKIRSSLYPVENTAVHDMKWNRTQCV